MLARRLCSLFLSLAFVAPIVPAQILTVNGPVTPGSTASFNIQNTSPSTLTYICGRLVGMLDQDGELITPDIQTVGDVICTVAPGSSISDSIPIPASGPGSQGSFVAFTPFGAGAVTRVDIGTPAAFFPQLHAFPSSIISGYGSHAQGPGRVTEVSIANLAPTPFVLSGTDGIQVRLPGSLTPLTTIGLSGLTVPANGTLEVSIPPVGIPAQPLEVEVLLIDPQVGPRFISFGTTVNGEVDLHFPEGRFIGAGTTVSGRAHISLTASGNSTPLYVFAIGIQPGSTILPGGAVLPLNINDPLVLESALTGIGGLLGNNVGTATMTFPPCFCFNRGWSRIDGLTIRHPSPTPLGGAVVRGALAVMDTTGLGWFTSQPVRFILE